MAVNKGEIGIYGVLRRDGGDGVIATADQIKDTLRGKMQEDLNQVYHSAAEDIEIHLENIMNPHSVTKAQVGLGNVTNDALVKRSELGKASGVATLDTSGKVPASLLPSFVNDVLEYATLSKFPTKGEDGKIYVTLDTNLTYRWTGTQYVEISQSLAVGETANSAFAGSRGKALETNLQLEITDRQAADTTLQTNVDNLSLTVTDNKTATDTAISDVSTALSNYKTEVANDYLPLTGGTLYNSDNPCSFYIKSGDLQIQNLVNNLQIYKTSKAEYECADNAVNEFTEGVSFIKYPNPRIESYRLILDKKGIIKTRIQEASCYYNKEYWITKLDQVGKIYDDVTMTKDAYSKDIYYNYTQESRISFNVDLNSNNITLYHKNGKKYCGVILSGATDDDVICANGGTKTIGTDIASQEAVDSKVDKTTTINNKPLSSNITLDKSDIGLTNVDNTSDLDKPISTATLKALDTKFGNNVVRTKNTFCAAPYDKDGVASFRSIEEVDLPDNVARSMVNTIAYSEEVILGEKLASDYTTVIKEKYIVFTNIGEFIRERTGSKVSTLKVIPDKNVKFSVYSYLGSGVITLGRNSDDSIDIQCDITENNVQYPIIICSDTPNVTFVCMFIYVSGLEPGGYIEDFFGGRSGGTNRSYTNMQLFSNLAGSATGFFPTSDRLPSCRNIKEYLDTTYTACTTDEINELFT